ncbi:D-glycero-alpha-D-manno-heptose-1,7-bisphosphate 7-phosphatase [Paracoccus benzoatiresistens]|uniref:D,D-heptose 1,7-bisphosphate phosphatase n=1 Tax=Paracoccus benzoatiresistens TaxID=2997341 RepID=A0ABT4J995_9RHOB|nr:HAD family hydrolase [Paracoccus sp. EF6]MCZ0963690.1 HAD family hydrolase [Paracoccus sp. EF6]
MSCVISATVPCLFLDRDGTIIVERNYLSDPDLVTLEVGAVEGLRRFHDAGFRLIVVSNQSGIGRGYFTEAQLAAVNERLESLLIAEGIEIASWHHCPHRSGDSCICRKPRTGMLDEAAKLLPPGAGVDWERSIMVGDKASDINAGLARGCRAALVLTGQGAGDVGEMRAAGVPVCASLHAVAEYFNL